jgi:hypothetical protein
MTTRNHSRQIAMGAALLLLAIAASSCGTALPTAPALDSSVSVERGAQTNGMLGTGDVFVIDDPSAPAGGPDVTMKPPAGEVIVPTPGALYKGTKTGWWNNPNRRHNR